MWILVGHGFRIVTTSYSASVETMFWVEPLLQLRDVGKVGDWGCLKTMDRWYNI
jgi:hypothetical protein